MTVAAQGDVLVLATAGTLASTPPKWRGGEGLLVIDNFSAANLEMQTPSGAWVPVKDYVTGTAIAAASTTFSFKLPACAIRLSAGGGTMNAWAIGI